MDSIKFLCIDMNRGSASCFSATDFKMYMTIQKAKHPQDKDDDPHYKDGSRWAVVVEGILPTKWTLYAGTEFNYEEAKSQLWHLKSSLHENLKNNRYNLTFQCLEKEEQDIEMFMS